MEAMNYVKPELIVVAFVLYFFGVALRQAQAVKNKYIPLILGAQRQRMSMSRRFRKKLNRLLRELQKKAWITSYP